MSLTTFEYTNVRPRATARPYSKTKTKITGTRHEGAHWKSAVGVLRAGIVNAVEHASRRTSVNDVGGDIIDAIHLLDAKSLHVLAVTFGMLLRVSERESR